MTGCPDRVDDLPRSGYIIRDPYCPVSMAIAAMLLFFAHFVLTDLDNPFEGTWNVRSEPFSDLVTKLR